MNEYLNKIICGDCLDIMPDLPDKSIDMILCDLPYGTTACKWDTVIPFEPLWEQYKVRCSVCDFELVNMERFCPYCGQRLVQKSAKEKEFRAGA